MPLKAIRDLGHVVWPHVPGGAPRGRIGPAEGQAILNRAIVAAILAGPIGKGVAEAAGLSVRASSNAPWATVPVAFGLACAWGYLHYRWQGPEPPGPHGEGGPPR